MLDIGAGIGLLGLYGKCQGADRVVCLEPEAAGSTAGVRRKFDEFVTALGVDNITMRADTFQQYDPGDEHYDIIVMHSSINHLDEDACERLHRDDDARATYRGLFEKLCAMAAPGARLIVSDCSRHNLFGSLGLRSPFAPSIDWKKHQSPKLWARLLEEVGFREPRIRWTSYNTLRTPGRWVLGNRVAAFMTHSIFCLTMTKD